MKFFKIKPEVSLFELVSVFALLTTLILWIGSAKASQGHMGVTLFHIQEQLDKLAETDQKVSETLSELKQWRIDHEKYTTTTGSR